MKEQVHVGVNQAGEKRGVAQIDDFGARRMGDFGANFFYFVGVHEYFAWSGDAAGLDVEQARGV
jgi:hypothetical protein